jgi:hypothetical protein
VAHGRTTQEAAAAAQPPTSVWYETLDSQWRQQAINKVYAGKLLIQSNGSPVLLVAAYMCVPGYNTFVPWPKANTK